MNRGDTTVQELNDTLAVANLITNAIGLPMIVFGIYGLFTEFTATLFHPTARGTYDPMHLAIYSILLGVGISLVRFI